MTRVIVFSLGVMPFFTSILKFRLVQQSGSLTMSKLQETWTSKGPFQPEPFCNSVFAKISNARAKVILSPIASGPMKKASQVN